MYLFQPSAVTPRPQRRYLNRIYRRDVLSFMNRAKLEECRQVNLDFNEGIAKTIAEEKAPRRLFTWLTFGMHSTLHLDTTKLKNFRSVHSILCQRCVDLKAASSELAGQLLYTNRRRQDQVEIRLCVERAALNDASPSSVLVFTTTNVLTERTAYALLRLLCHLSPAEVVFEGIHFHSDIELNASLMVSVKQRRFRCARLCHWVEFADGGVQRKLARSLASSRNTIHCLQVVASAAMQEGDDDAVVDFMIDSGRHCQQVEIFVEESASEGWIDALVKRLTEYDFGVWKNPVQRTKFHFEEPPNAWPTSLPKGCASRIKFVDEMREELSLRFDLENPYAERTEPFRIIVRCGAKTMGISEVEVDFSIRHR